MLTIDPRSIVLLANFISVFCLVVLLIMCHSFPRSIAGLREWAWSCGIAIPASVLLSARGHIPPLLSVVAGNTLIAGVFLLMHASLRRFGGRPARHHRLAAALALFALLWTWVALSGNFPRYGILLSSLSNMIIMAACAAAAWSPRGHGAAGWLSAGTFAAGVLVMGLRFTTALGQLDAPPALFDTSLVHRAYLTTYLMVFLVATFGFMLMAGERLRRMLQDMNRNLEDAVAERTADLRQEMHRTRELARALARVADGERRRIGQELHDDLGQQLTGISLSARAVATEAGGQAPGLARLAKALETAAVESIGKLRRIAHGLMPVGPGAGRLRDALARLASSVSTLSPVACSFHHGGPVDVDDEDVATHLFRIAQEAVNNAVRHSRAKRVLLRLDKVGGKVSLSILDDGIGIDGRAAGPAQGDRGIGMHIMAFRASLIHYSFAVETSHGRGTAIKVTQC